MINIKRFIDKVTSQEGRNGRDVVLTIADARALRDEISKLIIDRYDESTKKEPTLNNDVIQVEMKGGKW